MMKCYVMCGIRLYVHSSFVKRVCLFRDASPDVWCLSLCWKEGGHKSRGLWGFLRGSCQTGLSEEGKLFCPCDARCVLTGHDLQDSCGTLDGDFDLNWEAEKELEAMACDGEDFIPPKIMVSVFKPATFICSGPVRLLTAAKFRICRVNEMSIPGHQCQCLLCSHSDERRCLKSQHSQINCISIAVWLVLMTGLPS